MNNMPPRLRAELAEDPFYRFCCRRFDGTGCAGRITWEHALIYAGRQVQERFAIIPLCERHHLREGLDKGLNIAIALYRARGEDFARYPKSDWARQRPLVLARFKKKLAPIKQWLDRHL